MLAGGRGDRQERREVRAELRRLGKEERQRQEKAVGEVLGAAQVVCTTLTGGWVGAAGGVGGGGQGTRAKRCCLQLAMGQVGQRARRRQQRALVS